MSIFNEKEEILAHIKENSSSTAFNEDIFEILEGNLIEQVKDSLKSQLSPASFESAMSRAAPINIFRKVVDKRSTLYTDNVTRKTDSDTDAELVLYYEKELDIKFKEQA